MMEIKETNELKRQKPPALERILALQLHFGTWIASGLIAAGLLLQWVSHPMASGLGPAASGLSWEKLVTAGIALFISLPVLRIGTMLVAFYRERNLRFVAIASAVLAILGVSLFVAK